MIRKLISLFLITTGLALPSRAATLWVSPTGSGSASCADSTTNAGTIARAEALADTGDVIRFKTGYYNESIDPPIDGTNTAWIRYLAFPAQPGAVSVANLLIDSTSATVQGKYISVNGLTVRGAASIDGGYRQARWDSLTNCRLLGGLSIDGGYNFITGCTIGDGGNLDKLSLNYNGVHMAFTKGNKLWDNTLALGTTGNDATAIMIRSQDSLYWSRNSGTLTADVSATDTHLFTIYGLTNSQVLDSKWTCSSSGDRTIYGLNLRDNIYGNTWARDSIIEASGSGQNVKVLFQTVGSSITGEYNGSNTFNGMYVRVRGFIGYESVSGSETHLFGQYITNTGTHWGEADSSTIRHCTIVNTGSGPVWDEIYSGVNRLRLGHTIFWDSDHLDCHRHLSVGPSAGTYWADSLLVYANGHPEDSTNVIHTGGCSRAALPADCKWASPVFANTSWETFDATPSPASLAYSTNLWADEYVGAIAPSTYSPQTITTSSPLPSQVVGTEFQIQLEAAGGTGVYTWEATGGTVLTNFDINLPTFEATGLLIGTAYSTGTFTLDVACTDGHPSTVYASYTITITPVPTAPTPPTLSEATIWAQDSLASVTFTVNDDTDTSATLLVGWALNSDPAGQPTKWGYPKRNYGSNTYGIWIPGLAPGSEHMLRITLQDGEDSDQLDTTFTTKAAKWWRQPVKGPLVYVNFTSGVDAPGYGDTDTTAVQTLSYGWAVLLAKPNYGKGGGLVILGPVPSHGWEGGNVGFSIPANAYATADSMYHILGGTSDAEITAAEPNIDTNYQYVTGGRTLAGINMRAISPNYSGLYRAAFAGADSMAGMWVYKSALSDTLYRLFKCTSRDEFLRGVGYNSSVADSFYIGKVQGRAYARGPRYFTPTADSIWYLMPDTLHSSSYDRLLLGWNSGLEINSPYIRVHGIKFTGAGGNWNFPQAAIYVNANGVVIDSCTFQANSVASVYALEKDSVVVAENTFLEDTYRFTYKATKGRLEEGSAAVNTAGSHWLIRGNTIAGQSNALRLYGSDTVTDGAKNVVIGNSIRHTVDDAIELDGGHALNTLVAANTIKRANNAISLTSHFGGPLWIIYNEISRTEIGAFKLAGNSGNVLVYHNTVFNPAAGSTSVYFQSGTGNKHFRNNVFMANSISIPPVYSTSATIGDDVLMATNSFNTNVYWNVAADSVLMSWPEGAAVVRLDSTEVRGTYAWETGMVGNIGVLNFADTTEAAQDLTVPARGRDRAAALLGINFPSSLYRSGSTAPDIGAWNPNRTITPSRRRPSWLRRLIDILL